QPPHLEDVWVRNLRPTTRLLDRARRQAILQATLTPPGDRAFGAPLTTTRTTVYLTPGHGVRSLASVTIAVHQLRFCASQREGALEPDYRVALSLPGLEGRFLCVKDHFLLQRAEAEALHPDGRVEALQRLVGEMGKQVVIRLGLSRPYQATPAHGP